MERLIIVTTQNGITPDGYTVRSVVQHRENWTGISNCIDSRGFGSVQRRSLSKTILHLRRHNPEGLHQWVRLYTCWWRPSGSKCPRWRILFDRMHLWMLPNPKGYSQYNMGWNFTNNVHYNDFCNAWLYPCVVLHTILIKTILPALVMTIILKELTTQKFVLDILHWTAIHTRLNCINTHTLEA